MRVTTGASEPDAGRVGFGVVGSVSGCCTAVKRAAKANAEERRSGASSPLRGCGSGSSGATGHLSSGARRLNFVVSGWLPLLAELAVSQD